MIHHGTLRTPRRYAPLLLGLALALSAAVQAEAPPPADFVLSLSPRPFTLIDETIDGRLFRSIRSEAVGRFADAGRPEIPVEALFVALPDGYRLSASIESLDEEELRGPPIAPAKRDTTIGGDPALAAAYDAAFYGSADLYPAGPRIEIGEPIRFRHQRVVPVTVRFFRTVPSTGALRIAHTMDVRFRFAPDRSAGKVAAPTPLPATDRRWEGLYRRTIVNYEDARRFRDAGADFAPPAKSHRPAGGECRIRVAEDGIYRIGFSAFEAAGYPSSTPISSVALVRRDYSDSLYAAGNDPFTEIVLPVEVEDAGTDGLFGPGDTLVAYLSGYRTDRMERDFEDRFDTLAAYFLTTGAGTAPAMESAWKDYLGLSPLASYPDSIRWESDVFYTFGPISDTTDLYFPFGKTQNKKTFTLELPPPDRSAPFRIKAMTVSTLATHAYHRYLLLHDASADTLLDRLVVGLKPDLYKDATAHAGSLLVAGENTFTYRGYRGRTAGNINVEGAGGFPDWFEVHGSFLYRAVNDRITFSTGDATGYVQIEVGGFSGPDIVLFDVTNPRTPIRIETDSVRTDSTGYAFALQDSIGGRRAYYACRRGAAFAPGGDGIAALADGDITTREGDYLIITWADFADALAPLVAHRQSQGFTKSVVTIDEVYDRFHGGVKNPLAIRRFLRYAFERWSTPPVFVLLVGDGFEDYKGAAGNAGEGEFDFVPAYPVWEPDPASEAADNWVASDAWYVMLDGDLDYLPEMLIGRFPVASAAETEALVAKTIAYETTDRDAPWRRRIAFVADDAWTYSYPSYINSRQTQFESGSREFAERVTDDAAIRVDTTSLWLSTYTDIYHPLCPHPSYPTNPNRAEVLCVLDFTRDIDQGPIGRFFEIVNDEGAFLVNFQGHGNRSSLTHELFLVDGKETAFTNQTFHDIADYSEPGAPPYIFMGFGCSISEFERIASFGNDALAEAMVLEQGTGAALTYGSTGIEFLGANLNLNRSILACFYPERDDSLWAIGGVEARSVAELITDGMARYAAANYSGYKTSRRYVILGDPALQIGPDAPDLTVIAGGDTVESGSTVLPGLGVDTLAIRTVYSSDVFLKDNGINVFEDGIAVPDTLWSTDFGIDGSTNRWRWTVSYDRHVGRKGDSLAIEFADLAGRVTPHDLVIGLELDLSFDGAVHTDSIVIGTASRLVLAIPTDIDLEPADVAIDAAGSSAPPDTLYRTGDVWIAEADLTLPVGEQVVTVFVAGLSSSFTVQVQDPAVRITAAIDGDSAASGATILGHRDGTPPELAWTVRFLAGLTMQEIRLIDGDTVVPADEYAVVTEQPGSEPGVSEAYHLTFQPALRNETYEIRVEADGDDGTTAAFSLHAGIPIAITIDGTEIVDGDFIAPVANARALVSFDGNLPDEEVAFIFDGAAVVLDSLHSEGDRWIATASVEGGGGDHTLAFHAGAFSVERTIRVENELRIVEPLAFPNPAPRKGPAGFVYRLTLPADEVSVEIFTVAGRKIRVIRGLSARAGYNENQDVWDGRDFDGDRLARGVYPFRIVARRGGESATATGQIVIGGD